MYYLHTFKIIKFLTLLYKRVRNGNLFQAFPSSSIQVCYAQIVFISNS